MAESGAADGQTGEGEKGGRKWWGGRKLANSNMQANSAHFLRGSRESLANCNYYLLDNQSKAQKGKKEERGEGVKSRPALR